MTTTLIVFLTLLFAVGSVSPLLIADDMQDIVSLD
jgi:hypothetical protein